MNKRFNKIVFFSLFTPIGVLGIITPALAEFSSSSSYLPSPYSLNESISNSSKEASLAVNAINGLAVDPFTGSANLNIPLSLPPGRAGIEPQLNLNYSPSNPNGILGLGWKLDMGYVERSTKNGIPEYNFNDKFNFCLFGAGSELASVGAGVFRPKRDPQNYKFTFDGAIWNAKDKQGRTFYFGDRLQLSSILTAAFKGGFRWNLAKVEDAKGNFMLIEYAPNEYSSPFEVSESYPSKIYYTRQEGVAQAAEISIEFLYETAARSDSVLNHRPGFYLNINKRLSGIKAWLIEGTSKKLIKSFTFGYKYSSQTNRSLLTKVTEFGSDGKTALPPLAFTYLDAAGPTYTITKLTDNSHYFGDFNGDGLTDLGNFGSVSGTMTVQLSHGSGFDAPVTWISNFGKDNTGLLLGDFNGDGRTDICAFYKAKGDFQVALSDGRKFNDKGLWLSGFHKDNDAFTAEINGDGLSDIIIYTKDSDIYYARSTGSSFIQSGFKINTFAVILGDFEGDGISDACGYGRYTGKWNLISLTASQTGSSVKEVSDLTAFVKGRQVFALDANNDGLTDAGYYKFATGRIQVRTFNGKVFSAVREVSAAFGLRAKDTKIQSADFNGDSLTDYVAYSGGKLEIAYSQGQFTDLLKKVDNGIGATLELSYRPSTDYINKRLDGTPGLPFVPPVFSQSKVSDGRGNAYFSTYSYMAGLFDDQEKEFAGFGYCQITDNEGNSTEKYFLQNKPLRGKLAKELAKDKNGNIFLKIENSWAAKELFPGVNLTYLAQTDTYAYDGDNTFKQTRVRYAYDDFGNPTNIAYDGDVELTGDEKTQILEYNYNTVDWLLSLPASLRLLDAQGNKVSEKRLYYDGASDLTTPPNEGLLTKEEVWLKNPLSNEEKFLSTQYGYDSVGNLTNVTDALGRANEIEYDSKLLQYPVKKTNALGQASRLTYDYGTGKILSSTGPNNNTVTYKYDVLGRLSKVIGPYDSASSPGIIYGYNLSSRPTSLAVWSRIMPLGTAGYGEYSYYDGLGRLIQTKTLSENGGYQIVSGVVKFDAQGRVKEKYLPYLAAQSNAYSPPKYSQTKAVFNYDCLGRLVKTTNPDGTSASTDYVDWVTTFVDENGYYKYSYQDAYGQVAKVEEQNNGQTYATNYEYDPSGNLTRIIDDQNNSTRFYYDSLGRKIRADDPDMGVWNYGYDDAGNLLRQADAKGQVIEFQYDELNRLVKKSFPNTENREPITYLYDDPSKPNCLGRLSKISDSSGVSEFFYDKLGRQIKAVKALNAGGTYTTECSFDALGRVLTLKYPDSTVIKYTYNPQGVETVSQVSPKAAKFVTAASYSPSGQMTKISYGNGAITSYTYDAKTLRMTNLAAKSLKGKLQDLKYQFDAVGNISAITDNKNTASSQDFLYDGLNRLVQARGSYGTATYAYDSIGNLVSKEGVNFAYGQGGAGPHALTSASDGSAFTYDENGNLSEELKPSGERLKYIYDAQNRLQRVGSPRREYALSLNLKPGWNLISLPVVPQDTNIFQVLKSLQFGADYDQVSRYNPATKTWEMFSNVPEFDQFFTLEYGRGYQIFVTNPNGAMLTVSGYLSISEATVPVSQGWNLAGFPCWPGQAIAVERMLSPLRLGADYDTVERFNTDTGKIEKYTSSVKQFSELKSGEAYFIKGLKNSSLRLAAQDNGLPPEYNEFTYDAEGSRVLKVSARGTTAYIDGLFEVDLNTGTTRKHIFAGSNRICTLTQDPGRTTHDTVYYHSDHLGSSNVISDATGKQAASYEYTPYGGFVSRPKTQDARLTTHYFTGKELDSSGLYYYGARYYNPATAHFTQPDPIIQNIYDPQTLNHYSYCRNNPLIYVDPTGMSWNSINNTLNSYDNGSFYWNFDNHNNYTGVSTVSNVGTQTTYNSSTQWMLDSWKTSQQFAKSSGKSAAFEAKVLGSALGTGVNYGLGQIGQGWNNFATNITQNDIFKGIQRGTSGFLSGLNKNFTDLAFKDLWSNATYQPKLSSIRTGLNSVQMLGVGITTLGLIQPYTNPTFSIDKAQTMVAIKGIKAIGVTGFAGWGCKLGLGLGALTGPYALAVSPIAAGVGAATFGFIADKVLSWGEREALKWGGLSD